MTLDIPTDHRAARAAVAAHLGDRLHSLRLLDDRRRLHDLLVFGGMWGVGIALAVLGVGLEGGARWSVLGVSVVVSALALNAFVLLLHEGMHGVLFRSRVLNRAVSVVLGAAILMSFSAYRVLHTQHHDALGTDDDPDDYHAYTSRPLAFWTLQFLRLTVGALLYLIAIPLVAARRGTAADRRQIAAEYVIGAVLIGTAVLVAPSDVLVWGWLAPLPLVALMTQVRGLTQHGLTDRHDALLASRTVRPHPLVAFLLLNENYHLEHHLFPEVPSYRLPELHRAVWGWLPRATEGRSYLGFLGRFVRQSVRHDETPVGVVRRA